MIQYIQLEWPRLNVKVRAKLMRDKAPHFCRELEKLLPFESIHGHTVISGHNMSIPMKLLWLEREYDAPRQPGCLFIYTNGQHMFFMFLQMCDDPDISLDVLKKLTHNELAVGFDSMQFLAYVSTPEIKEFARDIDAVLCQLQTKEEYKELIGVYDRYINLIHYWHHCTFPWHIGLMYQYKGTEEIDKMHQLARS